MAKRSTGNQVLENMSGNTGGGINFREVMVDLKVSPQVQKVVRNLRLIGVPIEYFEAQPRKKSVEDPSKTVQCPFPDAHLNKSFTRICEDDPSVDPWTQMGYIKTKRYAINCICVEGDTRTVKILARGKSIFGEFYKTERDNADENIELIAAGDDPIWTQVGGEDSPMVKIIAEFKEKALGNVEYSVRFSTKTNKITDEDIALLRAVGEPTPEKLAEIRKENPDLADYPDWSFYGYDLEKIFKPAILRTEAPVEVATPAEEMVINTADDDEEEVEVPKKAKAKAKVVEAEVEDEAEVVEEEITEEEVAW